MSIIRFEGVTKLYKNGRGIRDLSLAIEQGQIYGLIGPNGSGKTTAMKIMTGLIQADSGAVEVFGANPAEAIETALANVGCLIETPSFYPYFTARQNLEYIGRLYPACPPGQIVQTLERVGLAPYIDERVSNFSLGMKQRLGMAMALFTDPELLVLDEPGNGLDIEGMADVRAILQAQARKGRTILISSHLAAELEQICTDVAILREGVLLDIAKVPELLTEYGSIEKYYLALIGAKKGLAS